MSKLVQVLEYAHSATGLVIDRANGVVRGVKIVGSKSTNTHGIRQPDGRLVEGTDYTDAALLEEKELLENINVNLDHPPKDQADKVRSCADRFAWLDNIVFRPGEGNFGDLHFLNPEEPLAVRMLNAAEKKPNAFVLSHNAMGAGEVVGKRWRVTRVPRVNSVDIVTDGGTNHSLLEAREQARHKGLATVKTLKQLIESKTPKLSALLLPLLEDGEYGDMPVAEEAEDESWKDHLVKAIGKLVEGDDPECHELANKILAMLKPASEEEPVEEEDEDPEAKAAADKKEGTVKESREIRKKNKVLTILQEAKVFGTTSQVKALCGLDTDAEIKEVIATFSNKPGTAPAFPRSQAQGAGARTVKLTESKEAAETPSSILPNSDKLATALHSWN